MSHEAPPGSGVLLADRFQRVCPIHGIKLTGSGDELDCRYGHKVTVHSVLDTAKGTIVASSDPEPPAAAPATTRPTSTPARTSPPRSATGETAEPSPRPHRGSKGKDGGEQATIAKKGKWKLLEKLRFIEPNSETLTLNLFQRGDAFKLSWTTVLYRTAAEGEGNARDKIQSCGLAGRFEKRSAADTELKAQRERAASYGWLEQAYDPREPFRFSSVPKPGVLRARGKTSREVA